MFRDKLLGDETSSQTAEAKRAKKRNKQLRSKENNSVDKLGDEDENAVIKNRNEADIHLAKRPRVVGSGDGTARPTSGGNLDFADIFQQLDQAKMTDSDHQKPGKKGKGKDQGDLVNTTKLKK